jgi:hypothetical protein
MVLQLGVGGSKVVEGRIWKYVARVRPWTLA